jgi:16S rRNA (cytidine1402-2'-O)-methyltransferase
VGYLPVKEPDRTRHIRSLEQRALGEHSAQIFIEAPYRNIKLMETLIKSLKPSIRLTVACDITSKDEYIKTMRVDEWRKVQMPNIEKRPTIFILGI